MKIITQNCYGIGLKDNLPRFSLIAKEIDKLKPDIVLLQEVIFPFQVDCFNSLGYEMFFQKNSFYINGGLLTLVDKSLDPVGWSFERYNSQGKLFSRQILERFINKGFLTVTLNNGQKIVNTHLLCTYSDMFIFDQNQKDQLDQLMKHVINNKNIVLGGDFNLQEGSPHYQMIIKKVRDYTLGMGYSYLWRKSKIDYIFGPLNNKFSTRKYMEYAGQIYPSDHKGIFVEI